MIQLDFERYPREMGRRLSMRAGPIRRCLCLSDLYPRIDWLHALFPHVWKRNNLS